MLDRRSPDLSPVRACAAPDGSVDQEADVPRELKARHETMYGRVASEWSIADGRFELAVEVPANTRATVTLPRARLAGVTEGGAPLAAGNGIAALRQDGDGVVVEVGSGQYRFAYRLEK